MLCSGRYAVAQRAGSCVAVVFVLVDGFGNECCSLSWSFLCLLTLGCPQCTQQVTNVVIPLGSAVRTQRCMETAGSSKEADQPHQVIA